MEILWWGSHRRKAFSDEGIAARDRLADAARAGEWDVVLELAERHRSVNAVRVGGNSVFAPLHQAAWLGAPEAVVERLIELGAWRTLRIADGDTAADIADARGNDHLSALLAPQLVREVDATVLAQLECQLHAVILGRVLEPSRSNSPPTRTNSMSRAGVGWPVARGSGTGSGRTGSSSSTRASSSRGVSARSGRATPARRGWSTSRGLHGGPMSLERNARRGRGSRSRCAG
ncbi:ankyrin repeat domain-containing protein [Nocardia neocaledoniensis]|uniref:ankyrin repeat domain-containing protein n=1 Tax=Nocardia neocaledoniensis TaxID=236511 RepID=UPI002453DD54|nr:ankyrin repeat domain-containing protein [Nocardia neocaledoniensis]